MDPVPPVHLLEALFRDLNRRHFEGRLKPPRLELSRKLWTSAGLADYRRWAIRISMPYHERHGWDGELEATLLHEMLHLWLKQQGRPPGHTAEFKALAGRLGCPRYAKGMPERRQLRYRCGRCGVEAVYKRRVRLACRACCDRLNGGRFTARFLLAPAAGMALPAP